MAVHFNARRECWLGLVEVHPSDGAIAAPRAQLALREVLQPGQDIVRPGGAQPAPVHPGALRAVVAHRAQGGGDGAVQAVVARRAGEAEGLPGDGVVGAGGAGDGQRGAVGAVGAGAALPAHHPVDAGRHEAVVHEADRVLSIKEAVFIDVFSLIFF